MTAIGEAAPAAKRDSVADAALIVDGFERDYGAGTHVGPISFSVAPGEFVALLGPSGCGKTTTLRAIAGFERVDAGRILLNGQVIDHAPPHRRDIGLVFQNHALFPHLTVAENVAFGLKRKRVARGDIAPRVAAMLSMVGLSALQDRYPRHLSGGQQQRVALARSLVTQPGLLLLDEPLSALDQKLRIQMRSEIRALQRKLKTTSVFVTHDQEEALSMSDRIAVLSHGRIEQIGTPDEIYTRPASVFVADFIGLSNLMKAKVMGVVGAHLRLQTQTGLTLWSAAPMPAGRDVTVLLRPESIRLLPTSAADPQAAVSNRLPCSVQEVTYLGSSAQIRLSAGSGQELVAQLTAAERPSVGAGLVDAVFAPSDVLLLER